MHRIVIALCVSATCALAADKLTATQLIDLARTNPAKLQEALLATLGQERIHNGTALIGRGADFIWAVESASRPVLMVDDAPGPAMQKLGATNIWYAAGKLTTGTGHEFEYRIDGKPFGGSKDVSAFGPESYPKPGVPTGKLSEQLVHTSKIYDGMKSDYWIYVPAEYDPKTPAALMVFQDGRGYTRRDSEGNLFDVLDNLIYEKKIPVMIAVFIQPGNVPEGTPIYKELQDLIARMPPSNDRSGAAPRVTRQNVRIPQGMIRSLEYDTVSDRYVKFLRDEFLPEAIYSKYNVRRDGYSHAISGSSSGGICAFNAAWQAPGDFSRVLSWFGSFMSIQQVPNYGGQAYPAMVQRDAIRNIRVWLQDGENDQLTWPMQSLNMANSLKDTATISTSATVSARIIRRKAAEFPQSLTWLWRGYDPAKTEQAFEQDPAEAAKPLFRVRVFNRDHGPEY